MNFRKEWIRVNLEWTFVLFTHFGVTSGITRNPWVIPEVTPKWVKNTHVHSKFTLISLFSKIHSLKSEHIHSILFKEYKWNYTYTLDVNMIALQSCYCNKTDGIHSTWIQKGLLHFLIKTWFMSEWREAFATKVSCYNKGTREREIGKIKCNSTCIW